ncbi:hypothetical protein [Candidatus Binatus sp.]|uniref:hypothetical protein n=1 Tax=Candidatus Binatus sp. TaxID=2811406 RepID=UPI003BAF8AEF
MPMRNRSTPANKRGFTIELGIGAIAAAIAISGCGIAQAPIAHTPNVVATPLQGQLAVSVAAAPTVGEVTPVYLSIANGTDDTRSVVPSQVFAVNDTGERIAPLPPGEAARQAGSAKELSGAVQSGAVSGVGGAALGAAAGAIAGTAGHAGDFGFGSPSSGALIGTAFGGFWGAFTGAGKGQDRADSQANQQIDALSLKPEEVRRNYTVSGYVFFPKGQYSQVEMLLVDRETGDTQVVREPWH